ncbi:MAG TPA: hypothetical protein VLM79_23335 [Kofleriaceae bacterium]|nr:hypothetical protein [Kofleriaceae bacterium]
MHACSCRPAGDHCVIVDPAGFDLSDTDEVDIVGAAFPEAEPDCLGPDHSRADRADDVLALCALMVFKDRRRRPRRGPGAHALPGI